MNFKKILILVVSTIILSLYNCIPTDDAPTEIVVGNIFQGTLEDVKKIYTPETVAAIEELGFIINEGNTPPNIQGVYVIDPLKFEETNIPDDFDFSTTFLNVRFAITNQNNDNLTLNFKGYTGFTKYQVLESFISGEGNLFTIYLKILSTDLSNGSEGIFAYTFSGKKIQEGIENLSMSLVMLDDSRDFSNVFIDNNQGRRFSDSNNITPLLCPIGTRKFDGTLNAAFDIFPQNSIQTLQRLGMPINEGNSPPELPENQSFDPILEETTRGGLDDNLIFKDLFDIQISAPTVQDLVVDFDAKEGVFSSFDWLQGVHTVMSGSGNRFTLFSKVFTYDFNIDYQPLQLYIFSGTVNQEGNIDDFTYGLFMIDDGGDITSKYIENGDARFFKNQTDFTNSKKAFNPSFIAQELAANNKVDYPLLERKPNSINIVK